MEIQVEAYVTSPTGPVQAAHLDPAAREQLALWLKETWLNELFRGQAQVSPAREP